MSIEESLRTAMLAAPTIGPRVGGNRVAKNNAQPEWPAAGDPYIVYLRRGTEGEHTLDSVAGEPPFRQYFDVEVYGTDIALVDELAEAIKSTLNLYHGKLGAGRVQGIFVDDHNDQYQPRANIAELGLHAAFLDMQLAGYSEP